MRVKRELGNEFEEVRVECMGLDGWTRMQKMSSGFNLGLGGTES